MLDAFRSSDAIGLLRLRQYAKEASLQWSCFRAEELVAVLDKLFLQDIFIWLSFQNTTMEGPLKFPELTFANLYLNSN